MTVMAYQSNGVKVSVPASASGLGPGVGTLGLGLDLRLDVTFQPVAREGAQVSVRGVDELAFPHNEQNLSVKACWLTQDFLGEPRTGLTVSMRNAIPARAGLGTSVASVVAGVAAAFAMRPDAGDLTSKDFKQQMFSVAASMLGRQSATAASVYGNLVSVWLRQPQDVPSSVVGFPQAITRHNEWIAQAQPVHPAVQAALLLPAERRRGNLPLGAEPDYGEGTSEPFSRSRALSNIQRSVLLHSQLTGQNMPDNQLLFDATHDAMRLPLLDGALRESVLLVEHLRSQGFAAVLLGSGPAVLVLHADPDYQRTLARMKDAQESGSEAWNPYGVGIAPGMWSSSARPAWVNRIKQLVEHDWLANKRWSLTYMPLDKNGVQVTPLNAE